MTIIQGGVKITGFVQFTANYVPDTPTALTATWTTNVTNTVSLQFTAPVTAGSGPITSYTAVSNPAGFTATVAVNTNTVIIPGLSSSTYYVFNMYATNFAGNSLLSTASNVVYGLYSSPIQLSSYSVPTAPTSISATITSTNVTSTPSALVKFLPGTSQIPAISYSVLANGTLAGVGTSVPTTSYSGYFNGSSSYLVLPANANLVLGTVDFTIEMWVYPLATTNGSFFGNWTQATPDHGMKISFGRTSAGKFEFFYSSSGQSSPGVMVSANTYVANAWYHVAAIRIGSTVTLYVNGSSAVSGAYSNDMYENYFWVGTENPSYNTTWFNGYISNLRMIRYLAVYTGAFTPPTGPLSTTQTNSTNISSLSVANTVTVVTLQNAISIVDNSSFGRSITVSGVSTSTNQPFDTYAYVTVSNLSPLTSYVFQAYATNLVGNGAVSSTSSAITTYANPGASTYIFPGCYTWKAPTGVTSVSVLAVGGGGSGAPTGFCGNYTSNGGLSKFISSSVIQAGGGTSAAQYPYAGAAGGGGTGYSGYVAYSGGSGGCTSAGAARAGGGAAGYTGAGGNANGSSTGGGGGGGVTNGVSSGGGGGVGLFGLGANGTVGSSSPGGHYAGYGGSGGACGQCTGRGGLFGGGGPGLGGGGGGGGLAYLNNYTVIPNNCYAVTVGIGGAYSGSYVGGSGALRIVWPGQIRSFPSTAVVCYANSTSSQFVPSAPTITGIIANSGTAVTITYTASVYSGGNPITSYTAVSSDGVYYSTTSTSGSGSIFVKGLSPVTSYSFSVYATNSYGNSSNSSSLSTTTYVASSSVAYSMPGTYSWVAPANVTAVSIVAVGGGASGRGPDAYNNGGGASSFTMAIAPNTVYVSAGGGGANGGTVSVGTGYAGGAGGTSGCGVRPGGGGGAGGYSAAGGAGGAPGNSGSAGSGGSGGGGGGCNTSGGGGGGGVGIFGLGANGSAGSVATPGTGGSGGTAGGYASGFTGGSGGWIGGGGGATRKPCGGYVGNGGGGGALAYANNISVTPGSTYTVVAGGGGGNTGMSGGNGAVRIVWPGQTRSFPSTNVAQGYDSATDTLTLNNTYVPNSPTLTSASASSGTGITVNFTAPSSYYITPITSYTAVATTGTTSISATTASAGTILILGLSPVTTYTISVYANSTYGSSTASITTQVTTLVASGSAMYSIPGTYTWVVPTNVTAVSMIAVGGGASGRGLDGNNNNGGFSRFSMAALPNTVHVSAGGGSGQTGGSVIAGTGFSGGAAGGAGCSNQSGGGGGAGGYSAAGGAGGGGQNVDGSSATGGGGGGGGGRSPAGGGGGGVGLFGSGASGAGGANGVYGPGTGGSGGTTGGYGSGSFSNTGGFGGFFGGGGGGSFISGGAMPGGGGGALAYTNNLSVSAGASYTVVVGAGGTNTNMAGGNGAVRIVWPGQTRLFPSTNVAQGYDSATDPLTLNNTYVPGAPALASTYASSGTAVTVNFTAPSSYYITPITSYTAVATTGTTSISATTASAGTILILGLTPLTRYTVSVYATSIYGSSTASVTTQITTLVASGEGLYTTPGSFTWVAPANVTSVSVVAVGGGGGDATGCTQGTFGSQSYFINSSLVRGGGGGRGTGYVYCYGGGGGGDYAGTGGGNGGAGGSGNNSAGAGGGGGAGGYSGAGGAGGTGSNGSGVYAADGAAGAGGGGGGGGFKYTLQHGGGGGVGVYGQGSSGAGGTSSYSGTGSGGGGGSGGATASDSDRLGGAYGGGSGSVQSRASSGGGGGGLGYLNNYTVSSGTSYAVIVGAGGVRVGCSVGGGGGAVRIIWPGNVRTFPSTLVGPSSNL